MLGALLEPGAQGRGEGVQGGVTEGNFGGLQGFLGGGWGAVNIQCE